MYVWFEEERPSTDSGIHLTIWITGDLSNKITEYEAILVLTDDDNLKHPV